MLHEIQLDYLSQLNIILISFKSAFVLTIKSLFLRSYTQAHVVPNL